MSPIIDMVRTARRSVRFNPTANDGDRNNSLDPNIPDNWTISKLRQELVNLGVSVSPRSKHSLLLKKYKDTVRVGTNQATTSVPDSSEDSRRGLTSAHVSSPVVSPTEFKAIQETVSGLVSAVGSLTTVITNRQTYQSTQTAESSRLTEKDQEGFTLFSRPAENATDGDQSRLEQRTNTDPATVISSTDRQENDNSLTYWAVRVLLTADPEEKAKLTLKLGELWRSGEITLIGNHSPPEQPSRDPQLNIVAPGKEKKRGKGATQSSRISNLHSLANIEQWAIDLSLDIVARFSCLSSGGHLGTGHTLDATARQQLPKEFFDDFIKVACDEAKHFLLLSNRLKDLDSHFGALTVHNGLWESARETKDCLLARLAIVHMVHEARGLDVQPKTLAKFASQKDEKSVEVLKVIYADEITHVAAGLRWFTYACQHHNPPLECIPTFHDLVKKHFRGYLKPPFNTEGRDTAGMGPEWYMPLIKPQS